MDHLLISYPLQLERLAYYIYVTLDESKEVTAT